jgi:hypothetical protein
VLCASVAKSNLFRKSLLSTENLLTKSVGKSEQSVRIIRDIRVNNRSGTVGCNFVSTNKRLKMFYFKILQIVVTVWYYPLRSHSFGVCKFSGLAVNFTVL